MFDASFETLNTYAELVDRNKEAKKVISYFASNCGYANAALGGLSPVVPIPGVKALALTASIYAQIPTFKLLVTNLGRVYTAPPDSIPTGIIFENATLGAVGTLAANFGTNFVNEITPNVLKECGLGAFVSSGSIFSVATGASLGYAIAVTMTWRVGAMASLYYQNGHQWVNNRKSTYETSKKLSGRISRETQNRVDLDTILEEVPEVREKLVQNAMRHIRMVLKVNPKCTFDEVCEAIGEENISKTYMKEAFNRLDFKVS